MTLPQTPQKVWDLPVRLTHWLLVFGVGFSWWSAQNGHLLWHRYSGYTVLSLLLFRLYWGVCGSSSARFAEFVRPPRAVLAYLRSGARSVGHNPLGALSVLALLAALASQTVSGLFAVDTDGIESGPLSAWVSFATGRAAAQWHGLSFDALLVLIALHVLAIAAYRLFKRQDLLTPMISGRAHLPAGAAVHLRFASAARALPGVVLAVALVIAIANRFWL
ncbi:cytochrome b/b6 domain-containing protein [Sinimarinibacterium sp. NLF-5-8]|uniref:cytochrome b/b6 domain-containing protein n=1 Tax=Sinimarinibacterium sp. NLF-5-8 TaxID=2698684 RepID=UPI00137BDB07|nr:cytochrome b/b6 domain-containing protein [Sinimarinibacterium sp. NLF-5-8]QHS10127.1 Ni/Fe-hydrogenase 1 b-type cytochrome subunit [Sinimarinibacterium sp. NLF-5-8]